MDTISGDGRRAVLQRTREFIAALKATPAIERFATAQARFQTDPKVQQTLQVLQRNADAFQRAQQDGTLREEQIREVREAQARFRRLPPVHEFSQARDVAGLFLQETNRVISETLGLDLGQTAGPAGGAC